MPIILTFEGRHGKEGDDGSGGLRDQQDALVATRLRLAQEQTMAWGGDNHNLEK